MSNILLTGGTGFIGSHTAISLIEAGHNIFLFDNLSNSSSDVVEKINQVSSKRIKLIIGNILDTKLLEETIYTHSINSVIHFAGLKSVSDSVSKPLEYFINNISGTISLLQAMDRANIYNLVFSSSATVYGKPQELPIKENHPLSVVNPYGRTKLHIEEILRDISLANNSWNIISLRYFNPVGAHSSGIIGENPSNIPSNLFPYICQVASGMLPFLKIFGNDYETKDGTGVRDYIHVMDVADGHVSALNFIENNSGFHEVNLGTGTGYSVLEILNAFKSVCEIDIPFKFVPRREGDVPSCYADPTMAYELLDWKHKRNLEEMCKSSWNFQKQCK